MKVGFILPTILTIVGIIFGFIGIITLHGIFPWNLPICIIGGFLMGAGLRGFKMNSEK